MANYKQHLSFTIDWTHSFGRFIAVAIDVQINHFSITKVETPNGQIIKTSGQKLISPQQHAQFTILRKSLCVPSNCMRYIMKNLDSCNVDRSTCHYLAPLILDQIHARGAKYESRSFMMKVVLDVTREDILMLPRLEKKAFVDGGNQLSCAICLEELSGGDEYVETTCAHVFHHGCIVPWLVKKMSCPICRRMFGDER